VTDLLTRPDADELTRPVAARSVLAAAAASAAWAAVLGLAAVTVVVMIAWTASTTTAAAPSALRLSAGLWLLAQHASLDIGTGRSSATLGLLPLGAAVLVGALLVRAGRSLARHVAVTTARDAWTAAGGLAASYAVICAVVAKAATAPGIGPHIGQALVGGWVAGLVLGGAGVATAAGLAGGWWARAPYWITSLVRAAGVAGAAVVGCAAVGVAVALAAHAGRAAAIADGLAPGAVGGVALALLQVAYLPNLVVWATAYVIGPGFAVGAGTSYATAGYVGGATPAVPLLAALPGGPAPAWARILAIAVPVLAGVAAGHLLARRVSGGPLWRLPLLGLAAGALAACGIGALAALAGGPIGPGAMSTVGPSAWRVALLAAAEVGGGAAVGAAAVRLVGARRGSAGWRGFSPPRLRRR
jgi:Family of unknown function (DUF6350)